jgi:hypothetical protein
MLRNETAYRGVQGVARMTRLRITTHEREGKNKRVREYDMRGMCACM